MAVYYYYFRVLRIIRFNNFKLVYNVIMKRGTKVSEIAKIVGNNLRAARKLKGLTQKEVAEKLGKNQADYSDYETGKVQLDYEKIVFLCTLFDISYDELFEK